MQGLSESNIYDFKGSGSELNCPGGISKSFLIAHFSDHFTRHEGL